MDLPIDIKKKTNYLKCIIGKYIVTDIISIGNLVSDFYIDEYRNELF